MNADEYNAALAEIDTLMDDAEPGTPEAERLMHLVVEVEEYESEHYPMTACEQYLAKRRQDPEYRKTERRLKPYLDLLDFLFNVRMWLHDKLKPVRTALWSLWGDSGGEVEWP